MNIWLTTDWHLYNRPKDFSSYVKSLNYDKLMDKLHELVGPNDILICLGDLASRDNDHATEGTADKELGFFGNDIRNLPGYKLLVRGNHDALRDFEYIKLGFDMVCTSAVYDNMIFTHKPIPVGEDEINIHGHVHNEIFMSIDSRHIRIPPTEDSDDPPVLELDEVLRKAAVSKEYEYRGAPIANADKEFCHKLSTSKDYLDKVFYLEEAIEHIEAEMEYPVDECAIDIQETAKNKITWKNDKGEDVPKICPKCGSKVGVFLRGEPVFLCTNKDCNKYFGTVPFSDESTISLAEKRQLAKQRNVPVFICLFHFSSVLSTLIATITGDEYTHSAISFDTSLTDMYSFGKFYPNNPFIGRFVHESLFGPTYNQVTRHAIFAVFVTPEEKELMKAQLEWFIANKGKMRYNYEGLLKSLLHIADDDKVTKYEYLCSEFVATILKYCGRDFITTPSNLVKPNDFQNYKWCYYLGSGKNRAYDQAAVDRKLAEIMAARNRGDEMYLEAATPESDIWYHLVPKGADMSKGIMSPYYMEKSHEDALLSHSLDKYRDRMVNGWNLYPGRKARDLTNKEIATGLVSFRGKNGDRMIYLFRYPPTADLGPNMSSVLSGKDVYKVDLSKVPDIIEIDYGYEGSNTDNRKLSEKYYRNITPYQYFRNYDDNASGPLFASINHISVATKSGRIPPEAISKVDSSMNETGFKSTVDSDHTQKGKRSLNSFKRVALTEPIRQKYAERYPGLRHFNATDERNKAFIWVDRHDNIAAMLYVATFENDSDKRVWIEALEVTPEYKGYGLSKQLLDYATKTLHADALGVARDNELAQKIYLNYGFKFGKDVGKQDAAGEVNRLMYLGESSNSIMDETYVVDLPDLYLNIDQWKPGTLLFITGSSGDGKSTIANHLADEKNAVLMHTDLFLTRITKSKEKFEEIRIKRKDEVDDPISLKYIEEHPNLPYGKSFKDLSNRPIIEKCFRDYLYWVIDYVESNPPEYRNRYFIIEGCDIAVLGAEYLSTQPVIITGASRLTSIQRRKKRYMGRHPDTNIIKAYLLQVRNYINFARDLDIQKEQLRSDIDRITNEAAAPQVAGGFIGSNGVWNSLIVRNGKRYRQRAETLIIRDNMVLIQMKDNGKYKIPGGSTEKNLTAEQGAVKECQEEARITPVNLQYYGEYTEIYPPIKPGDWKSKLPKDLQYYGCISLVFVGEYGSPYTGKVDEKDYDDFYLKAQWIPISTALTFLRPEHANALTSYQNSFLHESVQIFKNMKIKVTRTRPKWIKSSDIEKCVDAANDVISEYNEKHDMTSEAKKMFTKVPKITDVMSDVVLDKLVPGGAIIKDAADLATANFYMWHSDTFRLLFVTHGISIDPRKSTVDVYLMDGHPSNYFKKLHSWKVDVSVFKRIKTNITNEAVSIPNVTTPQDLSNWMKSNLSYDHNDATWKLRSPEQVFSEQKGDCHDQSSFEYTMLKKMGYKCGRVFMIEYPGDTGYIYDAGATHTFCYYIDRNKYYWFENAWETHAGIHGPYNDHNSMLSDVEKNWRYSGKCDTLYIRKCGSVKPGMDLNDYVNACIPDKMIDPKLLGESVAPIDRSPKLYHGSNKKLTTLNPRECGDGKPYVYASPDRAYAAAYAGERWSDFEICQAREDSGRLAIIEMQPGMFRKKFHKNGYLYEIDPTDFKLLTEDEYGCEHSVTPIRVDEINVINELSGCGVKFYPYPKLPTYIPSRKEYFAGRAQVNYDYSQDKSVFKQAADAAKACGITLDEVYTGDAAELHAAMTNEEKIKAMKKYGLRIPGYSSDDDEDEKEKLKKKTKTKKPKNEESVMTPATDVNMSDYNFEPKDIYGNRLHNETSSKAIIAGMYGIEIPTVPEAIEEAAKKDEELYPVYVMLMHSGTDVANFIKFMTQAKFSHSSISFDASMNNMYTFGRKYEINQKIGTFKSENIHTDWFKERTIPYALYVVPVTKLELTNMKTRLDFFIKNESKFIYDFEGCIKTYFGISDNPEYRYFCSRFVADILHAGKPTTPKLTDPSLIKPMDFTDMPFAHYVTGGILNEYDEKQVRAITKQILREEQIRRKNELVEESVTDFKIDNPYRDAIYRYQTAGLDENALESIQKVLNSFKIRFGRDGSVVITRREYQNLRQHFNNSQKLMKASKKANNIEGMKAELAKTYYMSELITKYYMNNPKADPEVKKDMMDLRSTMINVVHGAIRDITKLNPEFDFQKYYAGTKYSDDIVLPKESLTAVGKALNTLIV